MADQNKANHPSAAFRHHSINEADRLFAEALSIASRAESSDGEAITWNEAGSLYEQSATLFRRADLGLIARDIYEQAGYCFDRAGASDDATRCAILANFSSVYWDSIR